MLLKLQTKWREGAHIGIKGSFDEIDMDALNAYKDGVEATKMYKGLTGLIDSRGIETINGWGRLVSQDTVEVNGRRLKGKNIVLASWFLL